MASAGVLCAGQDDVSLMVGNCLSGKSDPGQMARFHGLLEAPAEACFVGHQIPKLIE